MLRRGYKTAEERLFTRAWCDTSSGNGFKLEEDGFRIDIRKQLFTVRVVTHWNTLFREAVTVLLLEVSRPGWIES